MRDAEKEFQPIRFLDWVRGSCCYDTKAGFLLVAAGAAVLLATGLQVPISRGRAGHVLLAAGGILSLVSLLRDLGLLWRRGACRIVLRGRIRVP